MHYSQYYWGVLYIINLLLVSTAIGTIILLQPRLLNVSRLSRFLVGFCSTPFVLACWMLLVSALPFNTPRLFFILLPPLISILVIFIYRKQYPKLLSCGVKYIVKNFRKSNLIKVIYISTTIILLIVAYKMYVNLLPPIIANDAAQYLSEALKYSKTLSIKDINNFRGWPDGTLRGNIHNFIWPAYLSNALITTDLGSLGYPYDFAARLAFQVTIPYMLLSLIAFSGTTKLKGAGSLSILILLLVRDFEYISFQLSRDAFRIIPLLLLSTILIGSIRQAKTYRKFGKYLFLPLIAGYFVAGGHILNVLPALAIVISWLICVLKTNRLVCNHNARYLSIALAVALVVLAGCSQIIQAYMETGNIVGDAVYNNQIIVGTPMEKEYIESQEKRLEGTNSTFERLMVIISRDRYIISIAGLLTALNFSFGFRTHILKNKKNPLLFISMIVLINVITISDLFSWAGISLTKWYVMNSRYQLHFYPFTSICIAAFILTTFGSCSKEPLKNRCLIFKKVLLSVSIILIIFFSIKTVAYEWRQRDLTKTTDFLHQTVNPIKNAIREYPIKNVILDDMRYNYYLDSNAILMYTKPTWPIIKATNTEQVRNALDSLDVQLIALTDAGIKSHWGKTLLFEYLEKPGSSEIVCDNGYIKIYYIKKHY